MSDRNGVHLHPAESQQPVSREAIINARRRAALLEADLRVRRLEGIQRRQQRLRESEESWDWIGGVAEVYDRLRVDADGGNFFPISTAFDRRYGWNWPFWRTWQEHARLRASARVLCNMNAMARGTLQALTSFVVGKGFRYRAVARKGFLADRSILDAVQRVIDEFCELNAWHQREQEAFWRSRRDGECFLRRFREDDGTLMVRYVDPSHVIDPPDVDQETSLFGVYNEPDDLCAIKGFWVAYDGNAANGEFVPVDDIDHIKINVDMEVKRGLPDFSYDIYSTFRRTGRLIENMQEGGAIQSSIAMIRQHKAATPDQVNDFADSQRDYYRNNPLIGSGTNGNPEPTTRFLSGTILDIDGNQEYVAPPFASNTSGYVEMVQAGMRSVAVCWNAPEWLVSADSSNNNFASALVAESPFVKRCEREQEYYRSHFLNTVIEAVKHYCRVGRLRVNGYRYSWDEIRKAIDIEVTLPAIESRDKNQEASRARTLVEIGAASRQIIAEESGYDWERVKKDAEEYVKLGEKAPGAAPKPQPQPLSELRGLQGVQAVTSIQGQYYGGQLPREAAIAALVTLIGLPKEQAEALFPEKAPDPPGGGPQGQGGGDGQTGGGGLAGLLGGMAGGEGGEDQRPPEQDSTPPASQDDGSEEDLAENPLAALLGESEQSRPEPRDPSLTRRAWLVERLLAYSSVGQEEVCEPAEWARGRVLSLLEKGFSGEVIDKANRRRCFSDGRPVSCDKSGAGKKQGGGDGASHHDGPRTAEHLTQHLQSIRSGEVTGSHAATLMQHMARMPARELKAFAKEHGLRGAVGKDRLVDRLAQQSLFDGPAREHWTREARKAGVRPADLHGMASQVRAHAVRHAQQVDSMLTRARKDYARLTGGKTLSRSMKAFRGGDWANIPRFDELVRSLADVYPDLLGAHGYETGGDHDTYSDEAPQRLYDYLMMGQAPRMPREDAYRQALEYLRGQPRLARSSRQDEEAPF